MTSAIAAAARFGSPTHARRLSIRPTFVSMMCLRATALAGLQVDRRIPPPNHTDPWPDQIEIYSQIDPATCNATRPKVASISENSIKLEVDCSSHRRQADARTSGINNHAIHK